LSTQIDSKIFPKKQIKRKRKERKESNTAVLFFIASIVSERNGI
jgi:hypothetical protein